MSIFIDNKQELILAKKMGQNVDGSHEYLLKKDIVEASLQPSFNYENEERLEALNDTLYFIIDIKDFDLFDSTTLVIYKNKLYRYKVINKNRKYFNIRLDI